MRIVRVALLCCALVTLAVSTSFAQGQTTTRKPSLDKALEKAGNATDKIHVLVRYKRDTTGAAVRVKSRLAGKVDRIKVDHQALGVLVVEMRRGKLKDVCLTDPDVDGCSEDLAIRINAAQELLSTDPVVTDSVVVASSGSTTDSVTTSTTQTTTTSDWQYDAQRLRATLGIRSWDSAYGVGIAIIDSGIAPSPDLSGRIAAFYDFTAGGLATPPYDLYGHGTHIAGLIAGNGTLSMGKYVGVATGVRLIGLKVLDANGGGYTSDVIAAIEFAIANKSTLGIDVINLSLGHPIFESPATDPLVQAVEHAAAAGIVVVVSAGNYGYNATTGQVGYAGITSPGNAPSALTVGSLRTKATRDRSDDEVSLFSSRGPTWYEGRIKPDVIAPGQSLAAINDPSTTLYQNPALHADIEPYIKLSGTSMAAGVASGVVALIIQANRIDEGVGSAPLTPNTVKALLQFTALHVATDVTDPGVPSPLVEGAGGINAAGAMALARAIDPNVGMGKYWLDAAVDPFTTIGRTTYSWGQQIVWGDQIVWGNTVLWNRLAWARQIVWGDDDQIVWGDSLNLTLGANLVRESFNVWSHQIVWGNSFVTGLDDQIVWGDLDDQIVWGDDDQVVWGDSVAQPLGN